MAHLLRQPFELLKLGIIDTFILLDSLLKKLTEWTRQLRVTNHLFQKSAAFGVHLAVINITRRRKLGVPSYNAFHELQTHLTN